LEGHTQDTRESSINSSIAPPAMREALNTLAGRNLGDTMRMIARKFSSGETALQIAYATGISAKLVGEYLDEVVRCLRCQPWRTADLDLLAPHGDIVRRKGRRPTRPGELKPDQVMIETKCASCGAAIEEDAERVLGAAMKLYYGHPQTNGTRGIRSSSAWNGRSTTASAVPREPRNLPYRIRGLYRRKMRGN